MFVRGGRRKKIRGVQRIPNLRPKLRLLYNKHIQHMVLCNVALAWKGKEQPVLMILALTARILTEIALSISGDQ